MSTSSVDRALADVMDHLDTPQYERPAQVHAWLRRRDALLPLLHTALAQNNPSFEVGVLSTILDYCRPEHFHYTWRPLTTRVDRNSAIAMDRRASKFGGDHPFLLDGEEGGARCSDCGAVMTFMFQLADDDLPEGVRGAFVPDAMRADDGNVNTRGVRPRPMLQLWQCSECINGCFDDVCRRDVKISSGPRWIDTAAYESSDDALPNNVLPERFSEIYYGARQRLSGIIHVLSGWSEPETDKPSVDEEYMYNTDDTERDSHSGSGGDSYNHSSADENVENEDHTIYADKLSGFGQWPNPLVIERCDICQSLCEPVFELRCLGSSLCERYISQDDLFLFSCPKHRHLMHTQTQGT